MITLERALKLLTFVREEPKDSNGGQAVEAFLKSCGLGKGYPWCAAYVSFTGKTLYGESWPLPMTASCAAMGEAARKKKIRFLKPQAGDVFLLYYPKLKRFAHCGWVLEVKKDGTCRTFEGNTNDGGSRDGWGVFERTRTFGPNDRFIRVQ